MPKILGAKMLTNRVFHVLCMTVHLSEADTSRSITLQLPIDIDSLQCVPTIVSRSRFQQKTSKYNIKSEDQPNVRQKKQSGKKVVQGVYCSYERLKHFTSKNGDSKLGDHQWDMMTRSDAKGSTRFAPWDTKKKETLGAIAKDVRYVLGYIRDKKLNE